MSAPAPRYLGIWGTDGDGWKILVWDDPEGELAKIQSRINDGEVFTSVVIATDRSGSTQRITLDSPVGSCELLPLEPTVVRGTIAPDQGDRLVFTPDR